MKLFEFNGYTCYLGQTAKENWELLNKSCDKDLFFHLSSFPSGYVILKYNEKYMPEMLVVAAKICKNGTKYRNFRELKVDYCYCDNLNKGENIGEVYFKNRHKVNQIKI